jgi:hypothetical protein
MPMKMFSKKNVSYGLVTFIWQHVKKPQDVLRRTSFFIKLYDDLYHELTLKQLIVQKKVLRLLEALALPVEQQNEKKLTILCQKICLVKEEMMKEKKKNR